MPSTGGTGPCLPARRDGHTGPVLAAFRVRYTVCAALEGAAVGVQYLGGGFHGHR